MPVPIPIDRVPGSFDYYERYEPPPQLAHPVVKPSTKAQPPIGISLSSTPSLPAQWMRDVAIFELEKRAIFSKVWLLTSHACHFRKSGDYISGNYVFDYFIIRDRDNNYQAFHNVCRHRAYPVITKPSGSSLVVGCKYHGWSYNAKGDLVKAPKFDCVPDFDKSQNGLYKIHTHVTEHGFIFLNFDASPNPVPFDKHFARLVDEWKEWDFSQYEPYYKRVALGNFNWKTMTDGYQECYHCTIAHPGFADALDLKKYQVEPLSNSARHYAPKKTNPEELQRFTFVFPTNGVTVTPDFWYIMRTAPVSATQTRMEFDVFKRKGVDEETLEENKRFFTQVQQEDFDLCEKTQVNLNAGIYSTGVLHPSEERGVLYYQQEVVQYCKKHLSAERLQGRMIFPARPETYASQQNGHHASINNGQANRSAHVNGSGAMKAKPNGFSGSTNSKFRNSISGSSVREHFEVEDGEHSPGCEGSSICAELGVEALNW